MNAKTRLMHLALVGSLALPSCALLTKGSPIVPRYFSADVDLTSEGSEVSESSGEKRLRLGRIISGPHLRERMAYRTSDEEMGFYNDRRWTERPETYLRRALSQALFEASGLTRTVSGSAPNLDAELIAFEEIKGDEHKVRVQIAMNLDGLPNGSLTRTITVEREVAGNNDEDPAPVVRALSAALAEAVGETREKVLAQLALMPAADAPETPPPAQPPPH